MAGMLQIITYLLAVYLVMKGVEILQIALASPRESRGVVIVIGLIALAACVVAAVHFVDMQDSMANRVGTSTR